MANQTKEPRKYTAYKKITNKVKHFLWENGLHGWVYCPKPPRLSKNANKKTSVIFYELFDIANNIYQDSERHSFAFVSQIGSVKDFSELMGCSTSLASITIRKAKSKWDYYAQRERRRTADLEGNEITAYFILRERVLDWYMECDPMNMDENHEKIILSIEGTELTMFDPKDLVKFAQIALVSLLDVRDLKERVR